MSDIKTFTKGTVIFKEGVMESCFYDIQSGKVGIYAGYGTPEEHLLTELGAGRYFGEMGLIDAQARSATAVALEDTEAELVDLASFCSYFTKEPEKILGIMTSMSLRLRELSGQYDDACNTMSEYLSATKEKKPKLLARLWEHYKEASHYYYLAQAESPSLLIGSYNDEYWF